MADVFVETKMVGRVYEITKGEKNSLATGYNEKGVTIDVDRD